MAVALPVRETIDNPIFYYDAILGVNEEGTYTLKKTLIKINKDVYHLRIKATASKMSFFTKSGLALRKVESGRGSPEVTKIVLQFAFMPV